MKRGINMVSGSGARPALCPTQTSGPDLNSGTEALEEDPVDIRGAS